MEYLDRIHGQTEISGVAKALIQTAPFQRLKRIHQGGAIVLVRPELNHTRFQHSIGVYLLIRKLGGSVAEQIAGLLHDISHTAFSHLVDYVINQEAEDYHELIYEDIIRGPAISETLEAYGFSPDQLINLEPYTLLEYPLPGLSADRVDYTLRDLLQLDWINKAEIQEFLPALAVFQGRIVVTTKPAAIWFSQQYDRLVQSYFNSVESQHVNGLMRDLIRAHLDTGELTMEDFAGDDHSFMDRLASVCGVPTSQLIEQLKRDSPAKSSIRTKTRKVDPEILTEGDSVRLSEYS